jgi:hypothetical protein
MISTRHLSRLPDHAGFRRLTRSLAMLDAILSPEWEYRYYSFNSRWADGEMMASMRDGCGDHWFALFSSRGVALHGLAHEAPMYRMDNPWPGVLESVPSILGGFLTEPAFDTKNTTFCIWRTAEDTSWQVGPVQYPPGDDPDGSGGLLAILDAEPRTYLAWAEAYYEHPIDLTAVEALYAHAGLSDELVRSLNPAATLAAIHDDVVEIGYPDAV